MTDFYVFRHGDTVESGNILIKLLGRWGDSHTLPILPEGIPALKKIGKYLKDIPTDANFTSPYKRCVDSSNIVGEISGKKYTVDERIGELERNGENFSHFKEKITDFLDEIERKKYKAVSICTHGAVIAAIKHLKTKNRFYIFQALDFPSPGNLIVIKGGKVEKINFNR